MTDQKVTIAGNSRPDVDLRTGGRAPSVVARAVPVGTPGLSIAQSNDAAQLVQALDLQTFSQIGAKVMKESRDEASKEGELARTQNQKDYATAVADGTIPATANPWFIKGYQAQDGRVAGLDYYGQMRAEYAKSEAKGSDDPKVYEKFVQDFTKGYMAKVGADKSADWMTGFSSEMQGAQKSLANEHAQQAEQAVIEKQAANTGAKINVILNGTRDPKAAAEAINVMGEKMRLQGMPAAAYEKVVAEAILAKAKMGDGNMLKALEGVKTGDGKGTLASNPKVVSASVDVQNFLTEKARGDTRWAWANDDRQWTLGQRKRAEETQKREDERWVKSEAQWGREEKSRSLISQITTSTLVDPANAMVNNTERLKQLAEIDGKAAESSAGFIDAFLTKRERVPDAVERPVLAQLQRDMVMAAGDPSRMKQLLLDANGLFSAGKIGRESVARFIDDAQKFSSWDPGTQRKLQDPQLNRVRQAGQQAFMDGKSTSLYGSAAVDALVVEQVIDRAALDLLHAKPTATGEELAMAATKALQGVLPTLKPGFGNPNEGGRAASLGAQATEAQRNLTNSQPQDGNTPPAPPPINAEAAAKAVAPADAQTFVASVQAAMQSGGYPAMVSAIKDFNLRMQVPGLGEKLLELHSASKPKAAPKKPK